MSPQQQQQQQQVSEAALLCQSCDRCRARKTRCDGQRPCLGCVTKYRKAHNLGNSSSIEELPQEVFDCVYSPAKRRGPVPGRAQTRKHKHLPVGHASDGFNNENATRRSSWVANTSTTHEQDVLSDPAMDGVEPPATRRVRTSSATTSLPKAPDTLTAHLHLLEPTSVQGNRLRAYFRLGVDEILCLAPIPTNDEFARQLGNETITTTATTLTPCQRHVLWAGRLGEVALGALVHNQVPLALELCNAAVHCLRECSRSEIQNVDATTTSTTTSTSTSSSSNAMGWELARAYFWLGTFRAFRGDMERYFKYRRVCLTHLSKSEDPKHELLLAAISFLDSWAYMVYNANEKELPDIDMPVVPVANNNNNNKNNFGCMDPSNQMWIQGAPPVYLNNEAPLPARSLDALACAVRQCCDQANNRFAEIHKEVNSSSTDSNETMQDTIPQNSIVTPTRTAVLANTDELCSRNMVLSAFALLQQHEASTSAPEKNQGHHLIISAMDAFLENGDEDGSGGFTDSQIQSLLSVCNIVIENPYLLFHAGPTYHMVSNSAVLICHLLNGMYATQYGSESHPNPEMETAVFDEILDTFLAVRKLLNIHRRKLPVKLRCHGIPRPNFLNSPTPTTNSSNGSNEDVPFIDLGNTLMCACRGCQGFVLMACSPCVAAERAQAAARKQELELTQETLDMEELYDFGNEFDLDDDELLNMLSRMIPT